MPKDDGLLYHSFIAKYYVKKKKKKNQGIIPIFPNLCGLQKNSWPLFYFVKCDEAPIIILSIPALLLKGKE